MSSSEDIPPSEDEFFLKPSDPILETLKLPLKQKMDILKRMIPMEQEDLEIYIVHSIRMGDLMFFEFLMTYEKILCPDWEGIGSLMYQYLLCEACRFSQPGIVVSLLKNIPDDHRLFNAKGTSQIGRAHV